MVLDFIFKNLQIFFCIILLGCIIFIIYYVSTEEISLKESFMLSIMQIIFSTIISWHLSEFYAKNQYQKDIAEIKEEFQSNLKTYALKASEKVDNLSNELIRLSTFLQDELSSSEESLAYDLLSKKERIQSAIHIINTLKSVNDKSLSDWKGVIPEEIDDLEEQKITQLSILNEVSSNLKDINNNVLPTGNPDMNAVKSELEIIRNKLDIYTSSSFGIPAISKPINSSRKKIEEVRNSCINCGMIFEYRQRARKSNVKKIQCPKCNLKMLSRWNEVVGFILEEDKVFEEAVDCNVCGYTNYVELRKVPEVSAEIECLNCGTRLNVFRNVDTSIRSRLIIRPKIEPVILQANIDEDFVERVRKLLPVQPWPKGTSTTIANNLNVSRTRVHKAIKILIKRDIFKDQKDGVLIEKNYDISNVI